MLTLRLVKVSHCDGPNTLHNVHARSRKRNSEYTSTGDESRVNSRVSQRVSSDSKFYE